VVALFDSNHERCIAILTQQHHIITKNQFERTKAIVTNTNMQFFAQLSLQTITRESSYANAPET